MCSFISLCRKSHSLWQYFFVNWTTLCILSHVPCGRKSATQTTMEESDRGTETLSSYLKQGQLRLHGRGLDRKSLTRTRKLSRKICRRPDPTTGSNNTNLFYHLRKNHVKQYGESLQMSPTKVHSSAQHKPPDSDVARGFCPRHTIWQRIMKMEGDNLHLQKHGPKLHGQETGVLCVGANTRPKVPNAN